MGRKFDDLLTEAWFKLEELRRATSNKPMLKWQKLSELTSDAGTLCGLSIYVKGLFRRKAFVEFHLAYDALNDCYRVSTWRKGYLPKEVFPGENSDNRPTLEETVSEIGRMIDIIRPLIAEGKLKASFPPDWLGKSAGQVLKDAMSKQ